MPLLGADAMLSYARKSGAGFAGENCPSAAAAG